MVYLRTNYRLTGKELDADAIGGVGKYIEQYLTTGDVSQIPNYFGGLCFFSWDGVIPTTSGVIPVSTYGVMCQTYGPTLTSGVFGAGFRFFPIIVTPGSGIMTQSAPKIVMLPANSYSTSIVLISVLHGSLASGFGVIDSNVSPTVSFRLFGFICSTPWS